jgi:hypothetical protein
LSFKKIDLMVLVIACAGLAGCAGEKKSMVEAPPPAPVVSPDQPVQTAESAPPQMSEVQDAVKRVFKDAVVIDTSHNPAFVAADFNGDNSQDLAVVLQPVASQLPAMNEEFPAWILRDLKAPESRAPRLRVAEKETLLAVIHGYGANGWRDAQATQTYLLKNAVGSAMAAQPVKEVTAAGHGKTLPRLRGDVVAQVLNGKPGYLYYAGATYSWYDPKTFKGEQEPGMVHGRPAELKK